MTSVAGDAAALQAAQTGSQIGVAMLKKAQDASESQLDLINSLPSAGGSVGPQGLDVKA